MRITTPYSTEGVLDDIIPSASKQLREYTPGSDPIHIRASNLTVSRRPIMERRCSVYYGREEAVPEEGAIYKIMGAERIRFHDCFEYDVIYVESIEPDCFSTWCVRTDGLIMNAESLEPRGGRCTFERVDI